MSDEHGEADVDDFGEFYDDDEDDDDELYRDQQSPWLRYFERARLHPENIYFYEES